jgi:hypothetical protein
MGRTLFWYLVGFYKDIGYTVQIILMYILRHNEGSSGVKYNLTLLEAAISSIMRATLEIRCPICLSYHHVS